MEQCQFLEKCGFFNNFQGNPEVIKEGWIRMYCNNYEKSETCARKKYRLEHGSPPADNVSPTGKAL